MTAWILIELKTILSGKIRVTEKLILIKKHFYNKIALSDFLYMLISEFMRQSIVIVYIETRILMLVAEHFRAIASWIWWYDDFQFNPWAG